MKINPKYFHLALIFYCLIIFILSSIPGDNFPEVDFKFSDKIVHVIIYAILFTLFFYSLKNQTKYIKLQKHSLEFALLFTAIYGMTDEIHQYFVVNRSCEFSDWVADVAGALIIYTGMKFTIRDYKKINSIFLISVMLLSGCASSGNENNEKNIKVKITQNEVWLNLMPTAGDKNSNIFCFIISLSFEDDSGNSKYEIKNLKIFLNNDTISGKEYRTEIIKESKNYLNINILQSTDEYYLNKNNENPKDAQFMFDIYKDNKKFQSIKTPDIIIKKVY